MNCGSVIHHDFKRKISVTLHRNMTGICRLVSHLADQACSENTDGQPRDTVPIDALNAPLYALFGSIDLQAHDILNQIRNWTNTTPPHKILHAITLRAIGSKVFRDRLLTVVRLEHRISVFLRQIPGEIPIPVYSKPFLYHALYWRPNRSFPVLAVFTIFLAVGGKTRNPAAPVE